MEVDKRPKRGDKGFVSPRLARSLWFQEGWVPVSSSQSSKAEVFSLGLMHQNVLEVTKTDAGRREARRQAEGGCAGAMGQRGPNDRAQGVGGSNLCLPWGPRAGAGAGPTPRGQLHL